MLSNYFIALCDELAEKVPEKETYFHNLQREHEECMFNVLVNTENIVREYYDILEKGTILKFVHICVFPQG